MSQPTAPAPQGAGRRARRGLALPAVTAAALVVAACGQDASDSPSQAEAQAATNGVVDVFPAPRSVTASARTEISLRGVASDQVGDVQVRGSRSGQVEGRLEPHADGQGASFVPAERLRGGERIRVATDLRVRNTDDGDWAFQVARRPAPRQVDDGTLELPDIPPGSARTFRSDRDLKAPKVQITKPPAEGTSEGKIFLSPVSLKDNPNPDGPMMLDEQGELVWFRQSRGATVFDFKAQQWKGEPVLTWWEGRFALGWGYGEYIVTDSSYGELMRISAGNGLRGDFHDMVLTDRGTALVMVYDRVRRDLRPVGGPRDGVLIDNVVQEIEPETGRVLFEWRSVGRVPLRDSRVRPKGRSTYDYFHANSIEEDTDGNLIVSARNTCALYKINRRTGALMWTLGGKDSDFEMGRGTRFCFQHDARRVSDDRISLFDNAAGPPQVRKESRAIVLELDEQARKVSLVKAYKHPQAFSAPNQASARVQENGNVFVGWGAAPVFSEFSPEGELLFNGVIASGKGSYRAIREPWTGRPDSAPSLATQRRGERLAVWASWNGATEVARWEILAGDSPETLQPVETVAREGFETSESIPAGATHVAVRALDGSGQELGRSETVRADS